MAWAVRPPGAWPLLAHFSLARSGHFSLARSGHCNLARCRALLLGGLRAGVKSGEYISYPFMITIVFVELALAKSVGLLTTYFEI